LRKIAQETKQSIAGAEVQPRHTIVMMVVAHWHLARIHGWISNTVVIVILENSPRRSRKLAVILQNSHVLVDKDS
jgi:hypothetical protein